MAQTPKPSAAGPQGVASGAKFKPKVTKCCTGKASLEAQVHLPPGLGQLSVGRVVLDGSGS